jgi:hypothetical protein
MYRTTTEQIPNNYRTNELVGQIAVFTGTVSDLVDDIPVVSTFKRQ